MADLCLTLGPGAVLGEHFSDDELAELWAEHSESIWQHLRAGESPWGYWRFSTEPPKRLRATRSELFIDVEDMEAQEAYDRLHAERAAWLAEHYPWLARVKSATGPWPE